MSNCCTYAVSSALDVAVHQVNVNVNKQYLSTRAVFINKGYDGCAMRVVFSKPQNCPGFNDGDFRDGGSAFQVTYGTRNCEGT